MRIHQWTRLFGALCCGLILVSGGHQTVFAEEIDCQGTLGAVTVDNVRVPFDAACTLNGTRVEGTINVESDATLRATDITVIGNIQAENANQIDVLGNSIVGGSIQIVQSGSARIENVQVTQDILFDANTQQLQATSNRVGGNLQAFQNTGGVVITNNTIDGNLQCKENNPAPTGGNNTVQGSKEDQCAQLSGGSGGGGGGSDDETCSSNLGAVTVENLRVPDNATCILNGTRVEGNIEVETNATLRATGVRVDGNVQAENARQVEVLGNSTVGGSIQIVQSGAARIDTVRIDGDILFDENNRSLSATSNRIGENLQAFQNTGGVVIANNTIDGNLQCKENNPAPVGGGNIVEGNKEDQCASLRWVSVIHLPVIL